MSNEETIMGTAKASLFLKLKCGACARKAEGAPQSADLVGWNELHLTGHVYPGWTQTGMKASVIICPDCVKKTISALYADASDVTTEAGPGSEFSTTPRQKDHADQPPDTIDSAREAKGENKHGG